MASEAVARKNKRHFVPVDQAPGPGLSARSREAVALLVVGASLYLFLSLWSFTLPAPGSDVVPRGGFANLGGVVGYYIAHGLLYVLGFASYVLVAFALVHGVVLFLHRSLEQPVLKVLGVVVFTAMVALLLAGPDGASGLSASAPWGGGGRFGQNLSPKLYRAFGGSGRILLLIFGGLLALLLATEWLISALLRGGIEGLEERVGQLRSRIAARAEADADQLDDDESEAGADHGDEAGEDEPEEAEFEEEQAEEEQAEQEGEDKEPERGAKDAGEPGAEEPAGADEPGESEPAPAPRPRRRSIAVRRPKRPKRRKPKAPQPLPADADYPFPPIELFHEAAPQDDGATRESIERNARAIERRLGSFRIGAKVVGVSQGPAVTQYEVQLEEGIKVSRITSFEPDLAGALKAVSVRVVAPIPGRDTVGVEVPNDDRQVVVMRELLELFGRGTDMAIPLFLGKDVAGEPIVEDLARMPHLLIAGTTGSGKSVCINAILLSVLMTRTPRQVRLILIDPKMVELQAFKAVPHLSCDVVTNMKKAPGVLEWAVEEMEKRYALFSAVGVNHIRRFNKLGKEQIEQRLQRPIEEAEAHMSYQVLVIDELADLMGQNRNEVEESIQRLAQKSRAVGLHVILATQRPSTDVITGVIKANLPCQIAFKVNRKIDSRVILDSNGAEKLLGHGDMLYVPPGAQRLLRAQGAFVRDDEIQNVVGYLEEQGQRPVFLPDLVQSKTGKKRGPRERDDLYDQAVEVVLGQQRGSATLLQRALSVGYTRATRLLEMMEEDGVVGPFVGSKSREVLLTLEEWQAREQAMEEELAALEEADGESAAVDGDEDPDELETPWEEDGRQAAG